MEYYLLIIRMVNFEKIDERSSTRISCTQPFETPYNCAWNIAARAWGGGGGKGKARLEGTTFGLEGGIPVIRRIRERRKTDGSWPGLDGRTDERASERRGGRWSERKRQASVTEIWPGRRSGEAEKREARERERERKSGRRRQRNGLGKGDRVGAGGRSTAPCMG